MCTPPFVKPAPSFAPDGPRLPDQLIRTADDLYIRFHGVKQWYRHDYSDEELTVWSKRIQASGAKRVWVYFNNDYEGYATKNARSFASILQAEGLEPAIKMTRLAD